MRKVFGWFFVSGRLATTALVISLFSAAYGWWGVRGLNDQVSKKASAEEVASLRGEVADKAERGAVGRIVAWSEGAATHLGKLDAAVDAARTEAAAAKREAGAMASKIRNLARSTDTRIGALEGQASQFKASVQAVMEAGARLEQRTTALERDVGNLHIARARQDSIIAVHRQLLLEADSTLTVLASLPNLRKAIAEYEKEQARRRAAAAAVRPDTTAAVPDTTAARASARR